MSYCRLTENSDVYIFGSGKVLQCILAWRIAEAARLPQNWHVRYEGKDGTAEKAMIGHVTWLRSRGVRVPERVISRLLREISEYDNAFEERDGQPSSA